MKSAVLLSLAALGLAAPTQERSSAPKTAINRARHQSKRADGSVDLDWFYGTVRHSILKYNKNAQLSGPFANAPLVIRKRDTDAEEPLTDQVESGIDDDYYGESTIGNQRFTLDFDTGSSDLFIPGPSCGAAQGCNANSPRYDEGGQNEGNTTSITYGSGQVTGENYYDSVTIAGLTAHHQNVISLTQAAGFNTSDFDGLCGFAFESIAQSKQPPFFFTLINQGSVNPTEFSFYLGRAASGTQDNSELTLGGRDSSKYTGSFTEVPVNSETYWQVGVDGVTIPNGLLGGADIITTAGNAAIDTGTSLILAPTLAALSIYAQIPGSIPIPAGVGETFFAYPCSAKPDVSIVFNNKPFAVNPLDFNLGSVNEQLGLDLANSTLAGQLANDYCLGAILGADLDPTEELYVVGDSFIKNWYSTFHYTSPSSAYVAFAKSV